MFDWVWPAFLLVFVAALTVIFLGTAIVTPSRMVRYIGREWTPQAHRRLVIETIAAFAAAVIGGYIGYLMAELFVKIVRELYTGRIWR